MADLAGSKNKQALTMAPLYSELAKATFLDALHSYLDRDGTTKREQVGRTGASQHHYLLASLAALLNAFYGFEPIDAKFWASHLVRALQPELSEEAVIDRHQITLLTKFIDNLGQYAEDRFEAISYAFPDRLAEEMVIELGHVEKRWSFPYVLLRADALDQCLNLIFGEPPAFDARMLFFAEIEFMAVHQLKHSLLKSTVERWLDKVVPDAFRAIPDLRSVVLNDGYAPKPIDVDHEAKLISTNIEAQHTLSLWSAQALKFIANAHKYYLIFISGSVPSSIFRNRKYIHDDILREKADTILFFLKWACDLDYDILMGSSKNVALFLVKEFSLSAKEAADAAPKILEILQQIQEQAARAHSVESAGPDREKSKTPQALPAKGEIMTWKDYLAANPEAPRDPGQYYIDHWKSYEAAGLTQAELRRRDEPLLIAIRNQHGKGASEYLPPAQRRVTRQLAADGDPNAIVRAHNADRQRIRRAKGQKHEL